MGWKDYRMRIDLLAAATEFSAIKNPQVLALATASREMWDTHKAYILGREVRQKEVKDDQDRVVHTPSWNLVLNFDYAIRARAAEFMNEGSESNGNKPMDIAAAMAAARRCEETRREHFLDKLHLQYIGRGKTGADSSQPTGDTQWGQATKRKKEHEAALKLAKQEKAKIAKKEKGDPTKGNGKGKDNKLPNGKTLATTHEGKPICFVYGNSNGNCKSGAKCRRLHVCQLCFGDHPWKECSLAN